MGLLCPLRGQNYDKIDKVLIYEQHELNATTITKMMDDLYNIVQVGMY